MTPISPHSRVAILGGGITGLTAAWQLRAAGIEPCVFEKSDRIGGTIGTLEIDGWRHELGPNSMIESSTEVSAFLDQIGLAGERLYAGSAVRNRYIVRAGRLVAMPASPAAFVTTRLFSSRAKLNLLGEPFRRRANADRDESVADFVVRRLGAEFLDYAVNPFVGGVYAGDPRRLSVRDGFPKLHALEQKHGSLIRGAFARRNASGGPKGRIFSFNEGMEELPRALARQLGPLVHLGATVQALRPRGHHWELDVAEHGVVRRELFSAVLCALPADALAKLNFEGVPGAGRLRSLAEIEHPPVASVFMGFRRDQVAHPLDGFGVLVPEVEQRRILGSLFSSTLFPGRAPANHVALTSFVGGTRQPEFARLDDGELAAVVQAELRELVGAGGEPAFVHIHRWPRAIPQYTLGYRRHKEAVAAFETAATGVFVGGNARDGISVTNCIESGRRLAAVVTEHLRHVDTVPPTELAPVLSS